MKRILAVAAVGLAACVGSFSQVEQTGEISFDKAEVNQVLGLYQEFRGLELVVDSRARRARPIQLYAKNISKAQTIQLLEKALLEQSGIVITQLDDKRVSVTYNDALPITKPANGQAR